MLGPRNDVNNVILETLLSGDHLGCHSNTVAQPNTNVSYFWPTIGTFWPGIGKIKLKFGIFKFVIVNFGRLLALFGQELANISSNLDKTGNFDPQQFI